MAIVEAFWHFSPFFWDVPNGENKFYWSSDWLFFVADWHPRLRALYIGKSRQFAKPKFQAPSFWSSRVWQLSCPHLKGAQIDDLHSLFRGVLIQSCSAGAKNFTKYAFFHVQFNGLVKNSQNHCAISVKFLKNDFLLYKID